VKLRELVMKFRRRSPQPGDDERSANSVNEAFKVGKAEAPASWIPSQQDRPRH
jgi:hypothetical protein